MLAAIKTYFLLAIIISAPICAIIWIFGGPGWASSILVMEFAGVLLYIAWSAYLSIFQGLMGTRPDQIQQQELNARMLQLLDEHDREHYQSL